MFNKVFSTIGALALVQTALAGVYITEPVGNTVSVGGETITVKWADNGQSPSVADIGPCSIDIYTGNVNSQTLLQNLGASVDVSKTSQIMTTIDTSIGEDGDYYFVRFTSLGLKDSKNPQYPYQSFSAKFTINHLQGKFNATVLAQIQDDAPAPSAAAASVVASAKPSASAKASTSAGASPAKSTGAGSLSYGVSGTLVALFAGLATYVSY